MEPLVSPTPPPGAPSPTSPTPRSTPDSASTPLAVAANSSSLAPASTSSFPSKPDARPSLLTGRSKEERWRDNSPSSVESAAAVPVTRSYRDAVLTPPKLAAPSKPSSSGVAKPPPRIVLRSTVHVPAPARRALDKDGWETVESRSKRRERAGSRGVLYLLTSEVFASTASPVHTVRCSASLKPGASSVVLSAIGRPSARADEQPPLEGRRRSPSASPCGGASHQL
ncbi:unnamed protein product [Urochloa humidicola]